MYFDLYRGEPDPDAVSRIRQRSCGPAAEHLDREHLVGYEIVRQMGELGLYGLLFPDEFAIRG